MIKPYIWALLAIAALLASTCVLAAPQDPLGKIGDERAMTMLTLVRQRLTELGVTNPQETIGLEFGYYGGCRVFLLEHLLVDGCIGFRVSEEIHAQAGPELLKQIVEDICRTEACPYRGEVAMTVRYFEETRFPPAPDGSFKTINTQVGEIFRCRIKGGAKQ